MRHPKMNFILISEVETEWNFLPKLYHTNKRRRIIVQHGNASSHKSAQISALLSAPNVNWCWQPLTSIYYRIPRKKCVVNDFLHDFLLDCSETIFWGVSIGVQKQTQMLVVHQNILSSVMLKNGKLSDGNVSWQLIDQP